MPYLQVENGLAQGKWLLYLTDPVEISPPGIGQCYLSPRHVNFLGLRKRTEAMASSSEAGLRRWTEDVASSSGEDNQRPRQAKPNLGPSSSNSFASFATKDDMFGSSESEDKLLSSQSSSSYSFSSSSLSSSSSRTSWLDRTVIGSSSRRSEQEEVEGVYSARVRRGSDHSRVVRRATDHVVEPDHVLDSEGRVARVVVFDCGRETAKCMTISCSIPALPRGSHAIVRLR